MIDKLAIESLKLLFREKAVEILLTIYYESQSGKDVYIQYVASRVNSPHSYVWLMVKKFEEAGLVETEVEGRTKIIRLTDKGFRISQLIEKIVETFSE
ncbi:conserved hypothetical protein [Ferroglobus placidus DSM 10642]|uniref:Uncharacterized protein n=1 Tax=Ferroglobus placidus (strain DSM 10642 / AEDII12DO) TaxID=589924 RepID=D3RWY6_FERPA|nr:hypothetical protein [Ferroglobus placidus]ADC64999.1 conserved hypothetical protein [Ferroglobus placidus DSM 10642]